MGEGKGRDPALLFSLRREHPLSGESGARNFMLACFEKGLDGSATVEDADSLLDTSLLFPAVLRWFLRPWRFLRLLRSRKPSALVVKIPTLGQLPVVRLLTLGYPGRVLVWVEGLCWQAPVWRQTFRLLLEEPLLSLSRMVLNNRFWARVSSGSRWEFVVSSLVQEDEIRAIIPRSEIHRIPNSFRHPCPSVSSRERSGAELRIGFLGHSYLIKGAKELLLALEILKKRGLPISAHFAFSDLGSRRLLRKVRCAGHRLEGKVELADFFQGIDLLVCPYWVGWGTNLFPNVLIESLYFGVPVLTTDLPMTREIFQDTDARAIFVPGPDPVALSNALGDLVSGEIKLPQREELMALFSKTFDPERTASQWKRLLAAPSPTP